MPKLYIFIIFVLILSNLITLYLIHTRTKIKKSIEIDYGLNTIELPLDLPFQRSGRLSHLIFTFFFGQINLVIESITSWKYFIPCHDTTDLNVELIFFVSTDDYLPINFDHYKKVLFQFYESIPYKVRKCFKSTKFINITLPSYTNELQQRSESARIVLENIINQTGYSNGSYIFQMEPDTRPFKERWLEALHYSVISPNEPFWMKGSIYIGNQQTNGVYRHNYYHINGNAIYNVHDPNFQDFIFFKQKEHLKKMDKLYGRMYAYDGNYALFITDPLEYEYTHKIRHKYIFSDIILNTYELELNLTYLNEKFPGFYLTHSKRNYLEFYQFNYPIIYNETLKNINTFTPLFNITRNKKF